MRRARFQQAALAGAVAALVAIGAAGCGGTKTGEQGLDEPAREGLAINVGGVAYDVFITRELNLKIPPDKAFYPGPLPKPGFSYYGVFLQACNNGKRPRQTVREFTVKDNQDDEFKPIPLPASNAFAYTSRKLDPSECVPEAGSVAQQGPTGGSMLLFEFPLTATENRPLELELTGPYDLRKAKREVKKVELDL
jgi:hypothetical protein